MAATEAAHAWPCWLVHRQDSLVLGLLEGMKPASVASRLPSAATKPQRKTADMRAPSHCALDLTTAPRATLPTILAEEPDASHGVPLMAVVWPRPRLVPDKRVYRGAILSTDDAERAYVHVPTYMFTSVSPEPCGAP